MHTVGPCWRRSTGRAGGRWHRPSPTTLHPPPSTCRSYFRSKGVLLGDYWTGLNRSAAGADFQYSNGSSALASNSNANPYLHWSWYHPNFATNAGYDCVLAWADLRSAPGCCGTGYVPAAVAPMPLLATHPDLATAAPPASACTSAHFAALRTVCAGCGCGWQSWRAATQNLRAAAQVRLILGRRQRRPALHARLLPDDPGLPQVWMDGLPLQRQGLLHLPVQLGRPAMQPAAQPAQPAPQPPQPAQPPSAAQLRATLQRDLLLRQPGVVLLLLRQGGGAVCGGFSGMRGHGRLACQVRERVPAVQCGAGGRAGVLACCRAAVLSGCCFC
jgi:hypothetical protein